MWWLSAHATQPPVATGDGTGSLWRALAVARLVLLGYAAMINVLHWQEYQRPVLAWAVFAVIAAWSVTVPWLYVVPRRRPWLLGLELVLGVGALLVTQYVQGAALLAPDSSTIPTYWIAAPVIAWAIHWGWRGGLTSALILAAVDVSIRVEPDANAGGYVFLLVLTGTKNSSPRYVGSPVMTPSSRRAWLGSCSVSTAGSRRSPQVRPPTRHA